MQKCPGQDTRFWGPKDVSEVACGRCGAVVEFFKTDGARHCPSCGSRVVNPRLSLGCAQWCDHARECLGFDPKPLLAAIKERQSLADQLVAAVKAEFDADQKRITHALRVLNQAEELLRQEGGDPRVVVAAALLHDIGIQEAERKHGSSAARFQELEGPPIARRILKGLGVDPETIEHVCRIVGSHHSRGLVDTIEFRVVWDADWIVNISEEPEAYDRGRIDSLAANLFRTAAGKAKAPSLPLPLAAPPTA
jgi:putative nucleotidyltransferase with HDIG domain